MAEELRPGKWSLQKVLHEDSPFCDFRACVMPLDHEGEHRCRCGKPVLVPRPNCWYHPSMPEPITVGALYLTLESLANSRVIEKSPVLIEGKSVVDIRVVGNCVVLRTFEQMLEEERL